MEDKKHPHLDENKYIPNLDVKLCSDCGRQENTYNWMKTNKHTNLMSKLYSNFGRQETSEFEHNYSNCGRLGTSKFGCAHIYQ